MMRTPVVFGLPGAGKTTVVRMLGCLTGMPVFESDPYFRECRAIGSSTADPRRAVHDRFLARVAGRWPRAFEAVRADVMSEDSPGRCVLHDGRRFRMMHGEDIFRSFETEMLAWSSEQGVLSGHLPDLSGSAPLYEENRLIFSCSNGYVPVLLDCPNSALIRNLITDYEAVRSGRSGAIAVARRTAYETVFEQAWDSVSNDEKEEELTKHKRLVVAAEALVERERRRRMGVFRKYAEKTIVPAEGETPEQIAGRILAHVRG